MHQTLKTVFNYVSKVNTSKFIKNTPLRVIFSILFSVFVIQQTRSIGGGKRGHIVADTLLLMTFPCARKLENICRGHKMFLNRIRNNFVSATNVARTGKRGNICVGNNVSSFASTLWIMNSAVSSKIMQLNDTPSCFETGKKGARILRLRVAWQIQHLISRLQRKDLSSNHTEATVQRCFADFQNFPVNQKTNNCIGKFQRKTHVDWFLGGYGTKNLMRYNHATSGYLNNYTTYIEVLLLYL